MSPKSMLETWPANSRARTTRPVRDITEPKPIPRGRTVSLEDYDAAAELWIVEYEGHIYLASPDELKG